MSKATSTDWRNSYALHCVETADGCIERAKDALSDLYDQLMELTRVLPGEIAARYLDEDSDVTVARLRELVCIADDASALHRRIQSGP